MRISFTTHYKNYPDEPDLTKRSLRIGRLTSTHFSIMYATLGCGLFIALGLMNAGIICGSIGLFAIPIALAIVRKVMFNKLDQEFAARVAAKQEQARKAAEQKAAELRAQEAAKKKAEEEKAAEAARKKAEEEKAAEAAKKKAEEEKAAAAKAAQEKAAAEAAAAAAKTAPVPEPVKIAPAADSYESMLPPLSDKPQPPVPCLILHSSSTNADFSMTKTSFTAGRDTSADLCLAQLPAAKYIARKQVSFAYSYDMWFIRDEGSSNGTFLNGQKLVPQQIYPISVGDQISLAGQENLVVRQLTR